MKPTLFFILLITILSCSNAPDFTGNFEDNCIDNNPEFSPQDVSNARELRLIYHENSTLSITEEDTGNETVFLTVEVIEGDNIVFEYYYEKKDKEMVADDEFSESIFFEVPTNLTTFLIQDDDMEDARVVYGSFCFCANAGYHYIPSGCIKGEKIDEEWLIALSLQKEFEYYSINEMLVGSFTKSDE